MIEVKNLKKEFVQNGKPLERLSGISTEFKKGERNFRAFGFWKKHVFKVP